MIELTITEHSPPGGEVFSTSLKPRGGPVVRLKCGCASDDYRHLAFCEAVYAEWLRVHSLALEGRIPDIEELVS